ncbi:DUF3604 domain-containing protein [Hyphococcus luteus]|nr:DUF3604 domain-containing protein [Marinicaulis flavus]
MTRMSVLKKKRRLICCELAFIALFFAASAKGAEFTVSPTTMNAGSLQTMQFTLEVGADGIETGGGLRVEVPVAYAETEFLMWSRPQTNNAQAPGYIWAKSSGSGAVDVRITGVLGGIIEAKVAAPLVEGDKLTIFYRGIVQSIAGEIDARYASLSSEGATWSNKAAFPKLKIEPAKASTLSIHFPSDLRVGKPFEVSLVATDKYGNLAKGFDGVVELDSTDQQAVLPSKVQFRAEDKGRVVIDDAVFFTAGFQKIQAEPNAHDLKIRYKYAWVGERAPARRRLFGDLHFHTGTGAGNRGFFTAPAGANLNTTDTSTFKELNLAGDHRANFTDAVRAYAYARDVSGLDFASTSEHSSRLMTEDIWRESQRISDSFYKPGAFTTFYGFEWTPALNHYVVMYKNKEGRPLSHLAYTTYPSLRDALVEQDVPALAIPHVSWRFENHNIWQDDVGDKFRPIGEIYSLWNSRHLVQPDNEPQLFELGSDDKWSYQYAWRKGYKIGVIGASDNHLGHPGANDETTSIRHSGGLAVVMADENDRNSIWDSLHRRAAYATTGTQIYMDFTADGRIMGSEYRANSAPHFRAKIAGTNQLALVELVRLQDGLYSTVFSVAPNAETYFLDFKDESFSDRAMYYLRVTQADEYPNRLYSHSTADMAWSSPIWISAK